MNHKLLFMLMVLPFCSLAQQAKLGLLGNSTVGVDLIAKGFSSRGGVGDLISFNTSNSYFRFSTSVFYHENLGIELAYQGNMNITHNFNGFKSSIEYRYAPSDYYIHYDNSISSGSSFDYLAEFLLAGPTYKFKYKKIHFISKILFGSTQFTVTDATVYIKKKNSNEYITETYKQNKNSAGGLNINAGINILYFVYKGLAVNMEFNYYECKVNPKSLNYTITTAYSVTGTESINVVKYNQALRQFSLGFGLCYYFKIGTVTQKH
jgi:hypothetical protein